MEDLAQQEGMLMDNLKPHQQKVFEDRYQFEGETMKGMWQRVAKALATPETNDNYYWEKKFFHVMKNMCFLPGGRILSAAGTGRKNPFFNCYVIESPNDSRHGIMENVTKMVDIMAGGGGVGVDLSSLRHKGALVKGVDGKSSGAVSWGNVYSEVTGTVEQGGSRRGALLLSLSVDHPDVLEFITAKQDQDLLTNANLSVLITDDFMKAVENNSTWQLRWNGKIVNNIKARELWQMIAESAWKSGEPGIVFIDRYNYMNNTWYFEDIKTVNPCGEQGLPVDGVCLLGNINLGNMVSATGEVLWYTLTNTTYTAVRMLDNAIDVSEYLYKSNEQKVKSGRRIGLGTMGLADMLLKSGIKYGSKEAVEFCDTLYKTIKNTAYKASVDIAKEKGAFPDFEPQQYLEGKFIQTLNPLIKKEIGECGIRNVCLLTVPPTGSTGMLADATTGIEPVFSWKTQRKDRLGEHEISHWLLDYFDEDDLPDYAVTAIDVPASEHVSMQVAIQKHIDSSISKTINLPSDASVEDVENAYMRAYKEGCKGMTVFRDQSRDKQVLYTFPEKTKNTEIRQVRPALKEASGKRYWIPTGCGVMWIHLYNDENGNLVECFITGGSSGGCKKFIETTSRQISLSLRAGVPLEKVIEQLEDVHGCESFKEAIKNGKEVTGTSCSTAIAETIKYHQEQKGEGFEEMKSDIIEMNGTSLIKPDVYKCPDCNKELVKQGNCYSCACGYSKCD